MILPKTLTLKRVVQFIEDTFNQDILYKKIYRKSIHFIIFFKESYKDTETFFIYEILPQNPPPNKNRCRFCKDFLVNYIFHIFDYKIEHRSGCR